MATNEEDITNVSSTNELLNLLISAYLKGERSKIDSPKDFINELLPQLKTVMRAKK